MGCRKRVSPVQSMNFFLKKLLCKGLETILSLDPSQNCTSTLTSHQSMHTSHILYLSTGI